MTIMIRQHTKFPQLPDPTILPDHQPIHCPTANSGPLSRRSITNTMLIIVFDTYLIPESQGAWI